MKAEKSRNMPTEPSPIVVRPIQTHDEMQQAVLIQKDIWGFADLDVDPRSIMVVASRFGGQLLGAYDGDLLAGFAVGFSCCENGHAHIHSHRVGVLPAYQNRGVGRLLKLAQREDALARGIHQLQWTFDPLQPRNAYFNIMRLGGTARTYIPNLYGRTSSPLHGGLPTDRLLIEWDLDTPRVLEALAGRASPPSDTARQISFLLSPDAKSPDLLARLQVEFTGAFSQGYRVTCFHSDDTAATYSLEKA